MYDTTQVWNDLATTGRAQMHTLSRDPNLSQQLRVEADEEGVALKVDYKLSKARGDYTAYVSLRRAP